MIIPISILILVDLCQLSIVLTSYFTLWYWWSIMSHFNVLEGLCWIGTLLNDYFRLPHYSRIMSLCDTKKLIIWLYLVWFLFWLSYVDLVSSSMITSPRKIHVGCATLQHASMVILHHKVHQGLCHIQLGWPCLTYVDLLFSSMVMSHWKIHLRHVT